MSTNPTGLTSNIAKQIAAQASQKLNNSSAPANQGPRADAFAKATAPTNSPPPVTTAVATPGSAPAAPVGGTTAPTSPAAAARATANAPTTPSNVAAAIGMATSSVVFARVSAAAAVTVGETKDENKKETNKSINRGTEVGDKSSLALQGDNSSAGEEAAKTGATGGASGPGAAAA